jgi:hypothetical protein
METVKDFLYNDFTNCYLIEDNQQRLLSIDIEKAKIGQVFYFSPLLSFGDYDNSCAVERSNVRVFMEMFGNSPFVKKLTGWYGSEMIGIDIFCNDAEILETLDALADYPAINDGDVSVLESEMERECWESYLKNDLLSAIQKHYALDDIEIIEEDTFFQLYGKLCNDSNTYFEVEAGGVGYINIERLLTALPEEMPTCLKGEIYEN